MQFPHQPPGVCKPQFQKHCAEVTPGTFKLVNLNSKKWSHHQHTSLFAIHEAFGNGVGREDFIPEQKTQINISQITQSGPVLELN